MKVGVTFGVVRHIFVNLTLHSMGVLWMEFVFMCIL